MTTVQDIPVGAIVAGDNDRTRFDPDALARLAATIDEHGLVQPITVRPIDGGRFQIVAGERRYRAVLTLGWETIPAQVKPLDDEAVSGVMLAENTSRQDLDPVDEGRAYQRRIDEGRTIDDVAQTAGVTATRVRCRLGLILLVPEAQQLVTRGDLPLGHAQVMYEHGLDANRQRLALRALARTDMMTWQAFRDLVVKLRDDQYAEGQESMLFELVVQQAVEQTARERRRASRAELVEVIRRLVELIPDTDHPTRVEALDVLATG